MDSIASRSSVSLRSLFPSAQFVGAKDILCDACNHQSDHQHDRWTYAAGLSLECDPARDLIEAIGRGATSVITEQFLPSSIPQCIVPDVREAYASLCQSLAGNPCNKMLTIGIVGTHGKTTAALMVASMLKLVGSKVAYYTSLGASDGNDNSLKAHSDASANQLAHWLQASAEHQSPAAVIEITDEMFCSHAASGMTFDVLLFTGLRKSQRTDALQSRGIENGMTQLLSQLKDHGIVVYNADDARLNRWIARHQPHAISYGLDAAADVGGKRMRSLPGEQSLMVSAGNCVSPLTSLILGDHNARHMLGAIAVGYAFGLELFETIQGVERLTKIPGRLQRVPSHQTMDVYIDVADQADRLAVSLHALSRHGLPITCVAEVPEGATSEQLAAYGRVLERSASRVILTQCRQSNRFGQRAIWEVLDGCENPSAIHIVPNRETAIALAIRGGTVGEQILLAGWGANRWTNSQSDQLHCDMDVAASLLTERPNQVSTPSVAAATAPLRLFNDRAA